MATQRTLIVGDVHGCLEELRSLLRLCGHDPAADRLIFVGDLINKGPDSLGVLEFVRSLQAEVVVGNHELAFLEWSGRRHFHSGSFARLEAEMGASRDFWLDWMAGLPAFIEAPEFLVVHAGLAPGLAPADTPRRVLANVRTWGAGGLRLDDPSDPPWFELYRDPKPVVFGHWARMGLVWRDNAIGLDTGCVYGKRLSALALPGRTLHQVDALRAHAPLRGD